MRATAQVRLPYLSLHNIKSDAGVGQTECVQYCLGSIATTVYVLTKSIHCFLLEDSLEKSMEVFGFRGDPGKAEQVTHTSLKTTAAIHLLYDPQQFFNL